MNDYQRGYVTTMKIAGLEKEANRFQEAFRKLRHIEGKPKPDLNAWKNTLKTPVPSEPGMPANWNRQNVAAKNTWNRWNDWLDPANRGTPEERIRASLSTLLRGE